MRDAATGKLTNALVLRQYDNNLKRSVYNQISWGINQLGVAHLWQKKLSPLLLIYKPTGQTIFFAGINGDPEKVKSIKTDIGYFKYLWFEELSEFDGPETIRSIQQSVLRGGDKFVVFYTFNPPQSIRSWVNNPALFDMPDMLRHHSTYLDVPRNWIGERFIADAEHLKETNPEKYEHEYLGVATGTGGEVFKNLKIQPITDNEIKLMQYKRYGIDWGFATDPFVYIVLGYDHKYRRLYIIDEIYKVGMSNRLAAQEIIKHDGMSKDLRCDSAEPKSIAEIRTYGLKARGAKKGPDSVEYGIHWLQGLDEIIVDKDRCPNAAREFSEYELARDAQGNLKAEYPDKNNHTIDAVRYACEDDMPARGGTRIGGF